MAPQIEMQSETTYYGSELLTVLLCGRIPLAVAVPPSLVWAHPTEIFGCQPAKTPDTDTPTHHIRYPLSAIRYPPQQEHKQRRDFPLYFLIKE